MRVSLKTVAAALAMMLGLTMFAAPGEARPAFYGGGGGGIVLARDHGFGHRGYGGGHNRSVNPFRGYARNNGHRFYRHGGFYRDRGFYRGRGYYRHGGFYGRRHGFGGPRFYGRRHYRGDGVVIRLR